MGFRWIPTWWDPTGMSSLDVLFPMNFPVAVILHQYFFGIVMFLISTFLVLLILVQRGRGGGLTGALGGPGGQSAFGTKAGDIFTRITVITAGIWIFTCALGVWWMQENEGPFGEDTKGPTVQKSEGSGDSEGSLGGETLPSGVTPSDSPAPPADDASKPATPPVAEESAKDFKPADGNASGAASGQPAGENPASDKPASGGGSN